MTQPGPVFDADHLAMVCGHDAAFQREIVEEFLQNLDEHVEGIASALTSGNPTGVHQGAHALKGSASTLGAPALAAACAGLETLGREGQLANAPPAVESVRQEAQRLRSALDLFLRDLAA